jgi:hypothetical protein
MAPETAGIWRMSDYRTSAMSSYRRLLDSLNISTRAHYAITVSLAILIFLSLLYFFELVKLLVNRGIGARGFPHSLLGRGLEQVPYLLLLAVLMAAIGMVAAGLRSAARHQLRRFARRLSAAMVRAAARVGAPQDSPDIEYAQALDDLHNRYLPTVAQPILSLAVIAAGVLFIAAQDPSLLAVIVLLNLLRIVLVRSPREGLAPLPIAVIPDAAGIRGFLLRRRRWVDGERQLNLLFRYITLSAVLGCGSYLVVSGQLSFGALVAVLFPLQELEAPFQQIVEWVCINRITRGAAGIASP